MSLLEKSRGVDWATKFVSFEVDFRFYALKSSFRFFIDMIGFELITFISWWLLLIIRPRLQLVFGIGGNWT